MEPVYSDFVRRHRRRSGLCSSCSSGNRRARHFVRDSKRCSAFSPQQRYCQLDRAGAARRRAGPHLVHHVRSQYRRSFQVVGRNAAEAVLAGSSLWSNASTVAGMLTFSPCLHGNICPCSGKKESLLFCKARNWLGRQMRTGHISCCCHCPQCLRDRCCPPSKLYTQNKSSGLALGSAYITLACI